MQGGTGDLESRERGLGVLALIKTLLGSTEYCCMNNSVTLCKFDINSGFVLFWAFEILWLAMTFLDKCLYKVSHDLNLTIFLEIFQKSIAISVWLRFNWQENLHKLVILYNQHHFPWLSMTHTWIPWLSRPGKWNHKIPWLSRFSMTCMNPVNYKTWLWT